MYDVSYRGKRLVYTEMIVVMTVVMIVVMSVQRETGLYGNDTYVHIL